MRRAVPILLTAGLLTAALPVGSMALLHADVSTIKPWNQLEINQQYSEFVRDVGTYSVQEVELTSEQVEDDLGSVLAVGVSNQMNRFTHGARIFKIAGIASKCAVAIRYDGDERYFVSTNRDYTPATLGNLIQDLGLEENLVLGDISYTYWKDNVQKKGNHITEKYTIEDSQVVWDQLLADTSLPVAKEVPNPLIGVMDIACDVNLIGEAGTSISVTTDGYLKTYVLGSGKVFFPGKKVTQTFIKYVTENGTRTSRTASGEDGPAEGTSLLGSKSVVK